VADPRDTDRGREDLIKAILRVLPIDPDDGTCPIEVIGKPLLKDGTRASRAYILHGDPRRLARRILDSLDDAYTNRDLQDEWNYMKHEGEDPF
jgi:hypothetical protein